MPNVKVPVWLLITLLMVCCYNLWLCNVADDILSCTTLNSVHNMRLCPSMSLHGESAHALQYSVTRVPCLTFFVLEFIVILLLELGKLELTLMFVCFLSRDCSNFNTNIHCIAGLHCKGNSDYSVWLYWTLHLWSLFSFVLNTYQSAIYIIYERSKHQLR